MSDKTKCENRPSTLGKDKLTPGYFWYPSLHPQWVGKVRITPGGGMSSEYAKDADVQAHFTTLKTLLDEVNITQATSTMA